jgi:hypothetical protein
MSCVLETLSLNELNIRKEHLLKQLQKVEFQIEKLKKNSQLFIENSIFSEEKIIQPNILENNFLINKEDEINIKKVKIKINIKKKI